MAKLAQCDQCGDTKEAKHDYPHDKPDEWMSIYFSEKTNNEFGQHTFGLDICPNCSEAVKRILTEAIEKDRKHWAELEAKHG